MMELIVEAIDALGGEADASEIGKHIGHAREYVSRLANTDEGKLLVKSWRGPGNKVLFGRNEKTLLAHTAPEEPIELPF